MGEALASHPRFGVGDGLVGVVATPLTVEVAPGVAPGPVGVVVITSVFAPKTPLRRPRINQGAVDAEVLIGGQPCLLGLAVDLGEERTRNIGLEQAVAVFRKRRVIPHRLIARKPHEPAKQQIVVELLAQQALAAHRVEYLQQQRPKQPLRGYRRAAFARINRLEVLRHPRKCCIDHLAHRSQRVRARNPRVQRHVAEQSILAIIGPAHQNFLNKSRLSDQIMKPTRSSTFSTSC